MDNLPPTAQKALMGFMMGGSAGMTVGFLYGSFTALKFGPTPGKTYLSTIGTFMIQHGAMLGFFLSIGSLIRAEDNNQDLEFHTPATRIFEMAGRDVPNAAVHIFKVQSFPIPKVDYKIQLNSFQPLSLFYFAYLKLAKRVRKLKPGNLGAVKRVHDAQKELLEALYLVYYQADERIKFRRDYRTYLPLQDQMELNEGFSENILYACQVLQKGYRIRGIESHMEELRGPAIILYAAWQSLCTVFVDQAIKDSRPPYLNLEPVLNDFDKAWVEFEKIVCYSYFSIEFYGKPFCMEEIDDFQVLLSETVLYCFKSNLLTLDQIQNMDPITFFTIPRLAIVTSLVRMPGLIDLCGKNCKFSWFRRRSHVLNHLGLFLNMISPQLLIKLEKNLGGQSDDLGPNLQPIFLKICSIADDLQSGERSKQFAVLLSRVFNMYQKD